MYYLLHNRIPEFNATVVLLLNIILLCSSYLSYIFNILYSPTMPGQLTGLMLVCCCCIPTPMTLASGGSPMFPLVVHQTASPSIWLPVQSPRRGLSTDPGVTMWCVCWCSWRDDVCRVCEYYRGGIVVMDVIWRRLCVNLIWGRMI